MSARASPAMTVMALGLLASTARAGWTNWWLTQDQQAQRALEAGNTERAAQLFTDPRRRAYAEIEAKQYAAAAKRLAPLDDPESQYNRGNALAHGGDLQSALAAYDAALKHAPARSALQRDARHNRDLVARQLQSQKRGAKDQGQQSQGAPQGGAGQQQRPDQGKPSDQRQHADRQQGSGEQSKGESQQSKGQGAQSQQSQGQDGASQPSKAQDGQSQQSADESGSESKPSPAGDDKSAADAAASAARNGAQAPTPEQPAQNKGAGGQPPTPDRAGASPENRPAAASGAESAAKPTSEQTLALEQWLRQIPDDPAGLLRRKFLIEHLMKQGAEP